MNTVVVRHLTNVHIIISRGGFLSSGHRIAGCGTTINMTIFVSPLHTTEVSGDYSKQFVSYSPDYRRPYRTLMYDISKGMQLIYTETILLTAGKKGMVTLHAAQKCFIFSTQLCQ